MSNLFGDSWFLLNDVVSLRWMLTLLHFLWQGAVIGVVVVVVAKLLRHMSASLRYGLYLFALLSLPCCVALTFCVINVPERVTTAAPVPPAMLADAVPAETVVLPESPVVISPMIALPEVPQGNVPESPIMATAPPISMREDEAPAELQWITLLSLFAPWITACYAIGVFGFLLRLSIALWGGHRLRASANRLTDSRLLELIATEARQVGLRFVPVVAYCERVAVPTVVGILRPVVLLPASIITGLTSEEFAAIIGHEFAHIRRYDLWVNLLQRVIESLLFFHPVVWFLSRRLSAERELCCDDLVVRSGCAPMNYAGALLRMAELCAASRPTNAAALAADGDEPSLLEHRIQRLMNADKAPRLQLTRAGLLALMLTLALLVAVPPAVRNWAQADEPSKPAAQVNKTLPKDSIAEQADKDVQGEVTISGRIVMENGSPATKKGWMYYICRNENGTFNGAAGQYSDSFSMKCPKGTVWLIHFPDDYAPTWAGPFDLKTQSELNDVKLVLKPGTSRRVRITDEDGQPIAGATLVVHPVITNIGMVGPVHEQATDENGELLLEHLADIEYELRCSASGYQTLRTEALAINGDEPLLQTLQRSEVTTGIVLNADNSPAVGARLLACAEVFEGGSANSMASSGDGFWFGTEFAKTDSEGRFSMNQLSSGSHYLFVIETTDHARAIVHSIVAGQKDLKFTIPQRLDLRVNIVGDTSKLPQRNGQPFLGVRQRVNLRPELQSIYGGLIGADASIEGTETGSTAIFRGLAVDVHPTLEKQLVEVSLGYLNELKKTVEMNLSGATEVEFILPGDQAAAKTAEVETKYPHCIVNVENLKTRSLANAVAAFNQEAQESPVGVLQQPITEMETLDAIAASLNGAHVTDAFKAVLRDIAESRQLPPNVYFRRFTRLDDERQMQEVWWVRLVVESEGGPVYSVPVRTSTLKSRPYTQMERQQNASGLTLINRFVSYFAEPANILLAKEFPKDAVDRLVNSAETSIKAKNTETFQSLFDWNGASDETRAFVKSEFAMLADSTIHSIKVTPRDFRGELVHWSAYQHYQPNLEIVGYLDIEYSNTRRAAGRQPSVHAETTPTDPTDEKKESGSDEKERAETDETDGTRRANAQPLARTLSLEIGQVGNELRLVNYVPKDERRLPEGEVKGLSIRGHIEPLAAGTYLETTIITNPGTLLSGHVANEEVRQRDLNGKIEPAANAPLLQPNEKLNPESVRKSRNQVDENNRAQRPEPETQETEFESLQSQRGDTTIDRSDGELVFVDQKGLVCAMNLGSGDGLRIGTTFRVYSQHENDAGKIRQHRKWKGKIEIVRVDDEHVARARIVEQEVDNPVATGDQISSVLFARGQNVQIATFGMLEFDGHPGSDRAEFQRIIEHAGAEIVLQVDDDARILGGDAEELTIADIKNRLTEEIRFLVIGEPGMKNEMQAIKQEMLDAAKNKGVSVLPLSEFLDNIGYLRRQILFASTTNGARNESQHALLLKAVAEADLIPDEQARMKAQWDLVSYLVTAGLHDEAFQQAMKLRTANPQMCIYSLKTIAVDAVNRGDQATVSKAWDAAKKSNADSRTKFNHYVVQLGFQLNQPVSEMLAIAAAAKRDDQRRAYQDVRNELTWRGRIDEAYAVTNAHLSDLPKDFNDREMAYYCSSARSYDYNLKHDHIGQAIRIIEQMSKGQHRDAAINQLVDGLLYVAHPDKVSDERLALAEAWVGRIDDPIKQAASKAAILRLRLPGTSVEELERGFAAIDSREEKLTILRNILQKLLEEGRIEEADLILPREVQLVKEQPRPEQKSKFGNVNDEDGIRMTTWTHNAAIVRALHKVGRRDEAKARLEAMKNLPDSEPFFLVGNLAGIRLQLYMELEDFDAVEEYYSGAPDPISKFSMAAWMMQKGQFDRGWKHVTPFLATSSETIFPPEVREKNLYFVAQPFENLARELFKANRPDDALKIISKLPESRDTAHAFETFGELLVSNGHAAELEQWIARLPHETAKTHARIGALREMTKTKK